MRVGVSSTGDATMQACGKTLAFGRIAKQSTRTLRRFLGVAKVNDCLTFRPEDSTMLVGILRQHTAANRRNFKAPHDMAVAIGSANQAKVHFGSRRQGANRFRWFYPQCKLLKGGIPFPIPSN